MMAPGESSGPFSIDLQEKSVALRQTRQSVDLVSARQLTNEIYSQRARKMQRMIIYLTALITAMTVSAIVIAASHKPSDFRLRSGGVPPTQDDILF
jgi:hypothetical protein